MRWLPHRFYMDEHNACSVISEPSQRIRRRVSSFKDSSTLLINWEAIIIKVKSFSWQAHCLWWKPKIYIATQSKYRKRWKQSSTITQLLETLLLSIRICTGFSIDVNGWTQYVQCHYCVPTHCAQCVHP